MWTFRLACELDSWDCASFVTLTYDDEHLPADFGLHKSDLQGFFKRLRNEKEIKYYACGEYGSLGRPHYHAIVFGLDPYRSSDLVASKWTNCPDWQFDRRRGKKCAIGEVTRESMQYVVGYVQKKLSGPQAADEYGNKQRPFALMSKGLGKDYISKGCERWLKGYTYLNSKRIGIPRYFREKLDIQIKDFGIDLESEKKTIEAEIAKFWDECPGASKLSLSGQSRAFERWFENKEVKYSDKIFEDYRQRLKLLGGKV